MAIDKLTPNKFFQNIAQLDVTWLILYMEGRSEPTHVTYWRGLLEDTSTTQQLPSSIEQDIIQYSDTL